LVDGSAATTDSAATTATGIAATQASIPTAATADAPAAKPSRSTHFTFSHPVFQVKGGYFALTRQRKDVGFFVPLDAGLFGVTLLDTLCAEFKIASDSDDGKLLSLVGQGLNFVREIRPGDSIPKEILDGSASWSVEDRHHAIARDRLTYQVVSWIRGRESVVHEVEKLDQVIGDPEVIRDLARGYAAIGQELGGKTAKDAEFEANRLAREVVYIEALRDRFMYIINIGKGLQRMGKVYQAYKSVTQEISQVYGLLKRPVEKFSKKFRAVDEETGHVVAMIRDVDAAVVRIREIRDDLHFGFMTWDDLIEKWNAIEYQRGNPAVALIRETYRFLAQNYPVSVEWSLMSSRG
jgi:hypothetical protein